MINGSSQFLLKIIKPFRNWLIGLLFVTFCIAISASLKPYALKTLLNFFISLSHEDHSTGLIKNILFYFLASLFPVIAFRMHNFIFVNIIPSLKYYIPTFAMREVLSHHLFFFQKYPAANITNKIKELINAIPELIRIIFDDFLCGFFTTIIALITVGSVGYIYALGLLLWIAIYFIGSIAILKRAKKIGEEGIKFRSHVIAKIVETLENIKCIRLLCKEADEEKNIGLALENCRLLDRKKELCTVKTYAFQGFIFVAYQGICLYLLVKDYFALKVTLGDFALVLSINHFFVDYFRKISKTLVDFADFFGNLQEGIKVILFSKKIEEKNPKKVPSLRGDIIFKNIMFKYEDSSPLFQDFSLHIQAKEKIAILGHSGSGKSTFIDLLLRFYDVQAGEILIDGISLSDFSFHSLRSNFSVVPQIPILFRGTILENIRYGSERSTDEEVKRAAKIAEIDSFISTLPNGYHTLIDFLGRNLSAGQKQRISIARAILKEAPIMIFDEAMSHLDTITEGRVQKSLMTLMQDKR
jgi:ATP-binding cassette, subfamily B, bacterial